MKTVTARRSSRLSELSRLIRLGENDESPSIGLIELIGEVKPTQQELAELRVPDNLIARIYRDASKVVSKLDCTTSRKKKIRRNFLQAELDAGFKEKRKKSDSDRPRPKPHLAAAGAR